MLASIIAIVFCFGGYFAYLVLKQNGRFLLRLNAMEQELVMSRLSMGPRTTAVPAIPNQESNNDTETNSLAKSRINRSGLLPGIEAPDFNLAALSSERRVSLREYRGKPFVLIFISADCTPCDTLIRRLAQLQPERLTSGVLIVARGSVEQVAEKLRPLNFEIPVAIQQGWEISRLYGTFKMPSAYSVGSDGRVTTGVVGGADAILSLVCDSLGHLEQLSVCASIPTTQGENYEQYV